MLKGFKRFLLFISIPLFYQAALGQYQIGLVPRISPDKGVYQKVGFTEVNIRYGSPYVRARKIWGGLVPYEKVWRAGANNATTVEFGSDVVLQGERLPKGKYGFFILPREHGKWSVIFNKVHDQWGAFDYEETEDALRISVFPSFVQEFQEELTYSVENYGFQHGAIRFAWEYLRIRIEFDTDYVEQFRTEIESRVAKSNEDIQWVVYLQGAEHLASIQTELDLAKTWIDKGEAMSEKVNEWNKAFYPLDYVKGHLYWTKAKILGLQGQYQEAWNYGNRSIKADKKSMYYKRRNEGEDMDTLMADWKKMAEQE